jgi:hypothetical protein
MQFRRALEAAVVVAHGGIDLRLAKLVRSCCTAFESAQRIRRVMSYAGEPGTLAESTQTNGTATAKMQHGLSHAEWLSYDTALQAREAACDKALSALGLDRRDAADVWGQLYRGPALQTAPPASAAGASHHEPPDGAERARREA